jgi:peptidoglycan/xylan/chitin deacetylase (PgdA/CDA1 family)
MVTPETFERQLTFLKRHFVLLSAQDFRSSLRSARFPKRACLVTFDDGWHDNATVAMPILMRHEVPAVIFVATSMIGSHETFWQERLTRLLFTAARTTNAGEELLRELGLDPVSGLDDEAALRLVRNFVTTLKVAGQIGTVDDLLQRVEASLNVVDREVHDVGFDRFLNWQELRDLERTGYVTIGSHGHTHAPLPSLGRSRAGEDMAQAQRELRDHGLTGDWICAYPNGDVDGAVESAAMDVGIQVAFTTGHGHVSPGDNPLRLFRVNIHEASCRSVPEFFCRLLRLY